MTTQDTISAIAELLQKEFDGEVRFTTPVKVKASPYHEVNLYDAKLERGTVYLRAADGGFHDLQPGQMNADLVANSILQRLKLLLYERKD
jgi:hypothetical protein